jgi:cardiolipin synthase
VALVLLPYVTLPLYLMFGIRKVKSYQSAARRFALTMHVSGPDTLTARTQQLAAVMALPAASSYRQLNIHEDGTQALQTLRDMINGAARTIDLCTVVFARDGLGDEIAQSLKRRAKSGKRVRLLVDGIGAYLGGHTDFKSLSAAGVQVVFSCCLCVRLCGVVPTCEITARGSLQKASGYGAGPEILRLNIS